MHTSKKALEAILKGKKDVDMRHVVALHRILILLGLNRKLNGDLIERYREYDNAADVKVKDLIQMSSTFELSCFETQLAISASEKQHRSTLRRLEEEILQFRVAGDRGDCFHYLTSVLVDYCILKTCYIYGYQIKIQSLRQKFRVTIEKMFPVIEMGAFAGLHIEEKKRKLEELAAISHAFIIIEYFDDASVNCNVKKNQFGELEQPLEYLSSVTADWISSEEYTRNLLNAAANTHSLSSRKFEINYDVAFLSFASIVKGFYTKTARNARNLEQKLWRLTNVVDQQADMILDGGIAENYEILKSLSDTWISLSRQIQLLHRIMALADVHSLYASESILQSPRLHGDSESKTAYDGLGHGNNEFDEDSLFSSFDPVVFMDTKGLLLHGLHNLLAYHNGKRFYFTSEDSMKRFIARPGACIEKVQQILQMDRFELIPLMLNTDCPISRNHQAVNADLIQYYRSIVGNSRLSIIGVHEAASQTNLHFGYSQGEENSDWNEWDLRRNFFTILKLRKSSTRSTQTYITSGAKDKSTFCAITDDKASNTLETAFVK